MSSVYRFFANIGNLFTMPPSFFQRLTGRIEATPVVPQPQPTEEETQADQEVVQKAISEAVTTALNSDDFTKAVAAQLATQLQPTLKSALNISTVEENLGRRLDEIQTATTARLADLSNDVNKSKGTDKSAELQEAVTQINVLLAALGKDVKAIQEQIAQQDSTILSAHSEKLDTIATELAAVKESSATKSLASDVAALKNDIETASTSTSTGISGLGAQITSVQSAIEAQDTLLAEIKSSNSSPEILAGIKSSNESHASHTSALTTIASKDNSADLAALKSQVATLSTTVSELKSADISPEILSAVKSSNESHAAHATTLAEIKNAPAPVVEKVDLSTIESDVKTILTNLETQTSTLSDIKATTSTPAAVAEKTDITALEADVKTLLANLESHSGSVSELKSSSGASGAEILAAINAQDATLAQLKDVKASPEVIAAIEALKTDIAASKAELTATHDSVKAIDQADNSEVLSEVKAVKAAVDGIPKNDNTEVITEIKAVKTLVGEVKDGEILAEVKEIKVLVEKKNAIVVKTEEVGENDKGAEVKENGNGAEVAEKEVEA